MTETLIQLHLRRFADFSTGDRQRLLDHITAEDEATLVRHPEARERQALARGFLREVLGQALGCDPTELQFERTAHGKPFLRMAAAPAFNLTHSQEAVAVAWASTPLQLGVDVEDRSRQRQAALLARRKFSPGEIRAWEASTDPQLQWLATWTRKEALLKANGLGIRIDLTTVDTLAPNLAPGAFSHPELGELSWHSWQTADQVISLAWSGGAVRIVTDLPPALALINL